VIGLLNGEESILEAVAAASEVFVPVVVVGELYFGAAKSGRLQCVTH
jgi:predicted nucleic acid-binding protein